MQTLLNRLNSRDAAIMADAMQETRALPPDDLLKLLVLERQARVRRERLALFTVCAIGGIAFVLSLPYALKMKWNKLQFGALETPIVFFLGACYYGFIGKYKQAEGRLSVVLKETNDIRFIPYMLRLASDPITGLSGRSGGGIMAAFDLQDTLKRLLPQVRAQDAAMWSKADRAALLLPLAEPDMDFELAGDCLKILSLVGDSSAIPTIKLLWDKAAEKRAAISSPEEWKTLLEAASECLLHLEGGAGSRQNSGLLRSGDVAHNPLNIPLRPAYLDADNSAGEQSLRPGNSENAP